MFSGSLLLVTLQELRPPTDEGTDRLEWLRAKLGRFTPQVESSQLGGARLHPLLYGVFCDAIGEVLADVNTGRDPRDIMSFIPLLHLRYCDGVRMATYGGLLVKGSDLHLVESANFEELEFVLRKGEHGSFDISVPNLTLKEVRALHEHLPKAQDESHLSRIGLPESDIVAFKKIYRYYMSLGEILSA